MDGSGALLLILLLGLMYVLVVLPRRRQMARQQQMLSSLTVGSRIVTIGGIKGEVVALGEGTVDVAVAPGTVVTFVRDAVANVEPTAGPDAGPDGPDGPDAGASDDEAGEEGTA